MYDATINYALPIVAVTLALAWIVYSPKTIRARYQDTVIKPIKTPKPPLKPLENVIWNVKWPLNN